MGTRFTPEEVITYDKLMSPENAKASLDWLLHPWALYKLLHCNKLLYLSFLKEYKDQYFFHIKEKNITFSETLNFTTLLNVCLSSGYDYFDAVKVAKQLDSSEDKLSALWQNAWNFGKNISEDE